MSAVGRRLLALLARQVSQVLYCIGFHGRVHPGQRTCSCWEELDEDVASRRFRLFLARQASQVLYRTGFQGRPQPEQSRRWAAEIEEAICRRAVVFVVGYTFGIFLSESRERN